MLLTDVDAVARAGITAAARCAAFDREGTKTSDLDPVPPRQSDCDLAEYGVDGLLHFAMHEMRL